MNERIGMLGGFGSLGNRMAVVLDRALFAYTIAVGLVEIWHLTFPFIFLERVAHFSVISPALAAIGFLLFVCMLVFDRKRYFSSKLYLWIWLFVGAMVLSSVALLNFGAFGNGTSSSLVSNAKLIVWQIDFMLVIFPFCASLSKQRIARLVRIVYWATAALFVPCLIVSFVQFAQSVGYDAIYGLTAVSRQGFQGGRLYGVLMGVFCSGSMTAILFAVSALLAYKAKTALARLVYTLLGVMYLAYSVLSGARAVMVGVVVAALFVYILYFWRRTKGRKKGRVLDLIATSTVVLVVAVCSYTGAGTLFEAVPQSNADAQAQEAAEEESGEPDGLPGADSGLAGGASVEGAPAESVDKQAGAVADDAASGEPSEAKAAGAAAAGDVKEEKEPTGPDYTVVLYQPEEGEKKRDSSEYTIVASYLDGALLLSYVGGSTVPFDEASLESLRDDPRATFTSTWKLDREDGEIVVHRPDADDGSEVSNGRFQIWDAYLKVLLASPKNLLFGMSPGYYMPAIYDGFKDDHIYIVDYFIDNHPGAISQGLIYDVHNTYLGVLVKVGLVGFVPLAIFLVLLARDSIRRFMRQRTDEAAMLCAFAIVAFLMAACFFDNDLFLYTSSNSFAFWVAAGFLASSCVGSGEATQDDAGIAAEDGR